MTATDIQIRFGDIDALRHVNNVSIVQYYDLGLSHYMNNLGISNVFSGDGMAKVHIEMNFFDSIEMYDKIEVRTNVSKVGNRSITFSQTIVDKDSGKMKSDCLTIVAGFNLDSRQSVAISEDWKMAINEHESGSIKSDLDTYST